MSADRASGILRRLRSVKGDGHQIWIKGNAAFGRVLAGSIANDRGGTRTLDQRINLPHRLSPTTVQDLNLTHRLPLWRIFYGGYAPQVGGIAMGRKATVRVKNGHWFSEAGGVGRYFGRVDVVSYSEAMAKLWAAIAGDGGDRVPGLAVGSLRTNDPPNKLSTSDAGAQLLGVRVRPNTSCSRPNSSDFRGLRTHSKFLSSQSDDAGRSGINPEPQTSIHDHRRRVARPSPRLAPTPPLPRTPP